MFFHRGFPDLDTALFNEKIYVGWNLITWILGGLSLLKATTNTHLLMHSDVLFFFAVGSFIPLLQIRYGLIEIKERKSVGRQFVGTSGSVLSHSHHYQCYVVTGEDAKIAGGKDVRAGVISIVLCFFFAWFFVGSSIEADNHPPSPLPEDAKSHP